jgi:pyridoxamine 5'-phosphate oxidase-like protein
VILPRSVASVFERGRFCHVAARTERGPHLTPTVFAFSGGSLWATTSRGAVKARAWRRDSAVAGLVRDGDDAVSFVGRATPYDVLDAETWPTMLGRTPAVAVASLRFSRKNAKFFAGYAVDARHIPLAWTPPGRVFVEIEVRSATLLHGDDVVERVGDHGPAGGIASRAGFRAAGAVDAFVALPGHLRRSIGFDGVGVLALEARARTDVVPVRWLADDGPILTTVPVDVLNDLAGGPRLSSALAIDRPSWWRARRMLGCMVQGEADVFVPAEVRTGRRALAAAIERTGGDPDRDALLRLRPERVVWWEGWTSGSARVA